MIGFRYIVNTSWIDSFQNSAFYMSGLGPVTKMKNTNEKLFAGLYALASGVLYLSLIAYLLSEIFNIELFND